MSSQRRFSPLSVLLLLLWALTSGACVAAEISNAYLRVRYDPQTGSWRCWDSQGREVLSEVYAAVHASSAIAWTGDAKAHRGASIQGGEGKTILAVTDFPAGLRIEQEIELLSGEPGLLSRTRVKNESGQDIRLNFVTDIEGLRADNDERREVWAVLANSFNSWDQSGLQRLERGKTVHSNYSIAVNEPPLVAGYLSAKDAFGTFELHGNTWNRWDSLALRATSQFDGVVVRPGETRNTDPLYIAFPADAGRGLERYGRLVSERNQVRIWKENYTTWCSWYAGYGRVAQADLKALEEGTLANARVLSSQKLKELGMDAVRVVDDSNDELYGDWNFPYVPNGMGPLARKIRENGIRPGVWLAPAFVSESSSIYQNHKDWLQRNADGSLVVRKNFYGNTMHFLDPSHPDALSHLRQLFTRIREWGYEYVMIDFMHMLVWGDQFHDPTLTKVQIYRRALQAIREALGDRVYLLGCGALILPSVGLVDGMRVTTDTWGKSVPSTESMAARWFMHRNFWLNDPDAILTRDLTPEQIEAWATLMAVSGGVQTLGDNLLFLDSRRLDVIRRIHPILGEPGRPLDVFERTQSSLWDLPLKSAAEEWHLLALFNWEQNEPLKHDIDLPVVFGSSGPFLVYDFWNDGFVGEFSGKLEMTIPYWTARALSVRKATGSPQFISISNHISQGKVGLKNWEWNSVRKEISGVVDAPTSAPQVLTFYVPKGYTPGTCSTRGGSCSLAKQSELIWKMRLEPRDKEVDWSLGFIR